MKRNIIFAIFILLAALTFAHANDSEPAAEERRIMKDDTAAIVVKMDKEVFSKQDPVTFHISNNSGHAIFVQPLISAHNDLTLQGRVIDTRAKKTVITANHRASTLSVREYSQPARAKIDPGASFEGSWTGNQYVSTGPDESNDWSPQPAIGTFQIEIFYSTDLDKPIQGNDSAASVEFRRE